MAMYKAKEALHKLSDTHLTMAHGAEDIRGRQVLDTAGESLGEIDDLFVDEAEQKVRLLQVMSGGFLGLGKTTFLIPVEAIQRITNEAIYICQTRECVAGAPRYEPALVEKRHLCEVYSYYGYVPFWEPAYPEPQPPAPRLDEREGERINATVERVDPNQRTLVLKAVDGERMELKVPQALLAHLQAGDQVEVLIHKTDGSPERAMIGTPERSALGIVPPRPGELK
jgi:sporulation protein YlmC with PRC-barrel domain